MVRIHGIDVVDIECWRVVKDHCDNFVFEIMVGASDGSPSRPSVLGQATERGGFEGWKVIGKSYRGNYDCLVSTKEERHAIPIATGSVEHSEPDRQMQTDCFWLHTSTS